RGHADTDRGIEHPENHAPRPSHRDRHAGRWAATVPSRRRRHAVIALSCSRRPSMQQLWVHRGPSPQSSSVFLTAGQFRSVWLLYFAAVRQSIGQLSTSAKVAYPLPKGSTGFRQEIVRPVASSARTSVTWPAELQPGVG